MKIRLRGVKKVPIAGEFIRLDALLKFAAITSTGGEAKELIQSGSVSVGGELCSVRGKKIRPGDIVKIGKVFLIVQTKRSECQKEEGITE